MKSSAIAALITSLALAGCSSVREAKISESFQMNYDEVVPLKESAPDGAIYSRSNAGFFLGDRRAQRVGDVLSVTFDEALKAEKTLSADNIKKGSLNVSLPSALFGAGAINIPVLRDSSTGLASSTANSFTGNSNASQKNNMTGTVTVVITKVYENGNLWVQGQKMLTVNQGEEYVRVSGLIRPEDISSKNEVLSSRIAQAQITYTGAGTLNEATQVGWFATALNYLNPL